MGAEAVEDEGENDEAFAERFVTALEAVEAEQLEDDEAFAELWVVRMSTMPGMDQARFSKPVDADDAAVLAALEGLSGELHEPEVPFEQEHE